MALLAFPRSSLRCTGGAQNVRKIAMPSLLPSPSAQLLCSFLPIPQPAFDIFAKLLIGTKTRLEMVVGNGGTLSDRGRDYSRVDQETMF